MYKQLAATGAFFVATALLPVTAEDAPTMWAMTADAAQPAEPTNVILFIGDGMGFGHIDAAVFSRSGQQLDPNGNPPRLSFEAFPVAGMLTTSSADSFITDSAAAGTAIATGTKTNNGMLGMAPDNTPLVNLSEIAKDAGMMTGVVSSVGLNHATPAAFYGKVESRGNYDQILDQFFATDSVDILMGGGIFGDKYTVASVRQDYGTDMAIYDNGNLALMSPENVNGRRVFGSFDNNDSNNLDYASNEDRNNEPRLFEIVAPTVEVLADSGEPFFLMVESGAIDWAGHSNDIEKIVAETLEFDRAVEDTLAFLDANGLADNTLVIVTADHETGGLTLTGPYGSNVSGFDDMEFDFSSTGHTALAIPLFARGPHAETLAGRNDLTTVFRTINAVMQENGAIGVEDVAVAE